MESWVLWIKALHVLAVISWMAGMLYLPRLFVYHSKSEPHSKESATFKIMERRLLRGIMNPAMVVVWLSGIYLAYFFGDFHAHWLHAKLALVLLMSGLHGYLVGRVRAFSKDQNDQSPTFYRVINEVPTLLMIGIVILVIVKPF
jgi:protoporphyrinogen IX oxidase